MLPQSLLHQLISAGLYLCKVYKATNSSATPFPPTKAPQPVPFHMFPVHRWEVISGRKNNFCSGL